MCETLKLCLKNVSFTVDTDNSMGKSWDEAGVEWKGAEREKWETAVILSIYNNESVMC